ncbi:MAG: M23 family metallopeptidase [Proteobacteria bacterium]|nr:M23 family metallopeptidase [Pseudomonadota bacterium]
MLSGISFAFVYALNLEQGQDKGALYHLLNPVIQDIVTAEAPADDLLPAPTSLSAMVAENRAALRRAVFVSEEQRDGMIRRTLVVGPGETLTSRLMAGGITRTEAAKALEAMRAYVNPRKIAVGQKVAVLFKRGDTGEVFSGLELRADPTKLVTVARLSEDGFKGQTKDVIPEKHRFAMRATVQDGIYESGLRAGIPAGVLNTLIKSYSYQVDFQREIKPGDRFETLYEQATDEDGHGVGDATLIYAALQVGPKILPIYRVAMPAGSFEYYDATGKSVRKGLLRTPVEGAHLTSGFGMRLHPILGFSRMHKGVDFGAPSGAPIYAAGAGIVEEAGYHSGYGRYIRLRHNGHLSTAYAHLRQFGRGITRGARINQGDVIGYVGASGIATGPHLHYEVLVDNQQVNPLTVNVATNIVLEGKQLMAFQDWRSKVHSAFEQLVAEAEARRGVKVAHNQINGEVAR